MNQVLERDHGGWGLSAHNPPPVVALGALVPMRSLLPSAASAAAVPPRAAQGTPYPRTKQRPGCPLERDDSRGAEMRRQ